MKESSLSQKGDFFFVFDERAWFLPYLEVQMLHIVVHFAHVRSAQNLLYSLYWE